MTSRFRVLSTQIALAPKKVEKVVLACATLHNVLRKLTPDKYIEPGRMDKEIFETGTIQDGSWRDEATMIPLETNTTRNPGSQAKQIRKEFCHYFNNEGQVPWQRRMAGLD